MQFSNPLNIDAHYHGTGVEILHQHSEKIAAFVAGTGTGGTLMSTSRILKLYHPEMKTVAIDPAESPVMSGGQPGLHGIQGIGDGSKFLVDLDEVDDIIMIKTEEAKERERRLSKENGLFVGISSGANILGCERLLEKYPRMEGNIITVLADRGERYLSCI
jgi:cysteine synthase A